MNSFRRPGGWRRGGSGPVASSRSIDKPSLPRRRDCRDAAITVAVDGLPRTERFDWYNKEGRYAAVGSIPRTLPLRFMSEGERRRYDNKTGEFAAETSIE